MYCKSNVFIIKVVNTIWEIILSIKGTTPLSSTWNKVQKFEKKKKKKKWCKIVSYGKTWKN